MIKKHYSPEPKDPEKFQETFDKFYTRFAGVYDFVVKVIPVWKRWLNHVLPHIQGPRVLEVSFGTGYLLTQYANKFETHGVDYNDRMVEIAKRNLNRKNLNADLRQGDVENLPYEDGYFDTVVNTMSFTGYANGRRALSEMKRVLRPGGKLIMIDVNYPVNGNRTGMMLTRFWQVGGDIIRDVSALLDMEGFVYQDLEIGGFGSVHMYLCEKK